MITNISATAGYSQAGRHIAPETETLPQGFTQAASDFSKVMTDMDTAAVGAMSGKTATHDLVQAIAQAELAMETAVAIRDKVVEAYQEVMRMPV